MMRPAYIFPEKRRFYWLLGGFKNEGILEGAGTKTTPSQEGMAPQQQKQNTFAIPVASPTTKQRTVAPPIKNKNKP